jgi:hypothetical protein
MVQAIVNGLDIHSFNTNNVFNLGYTNENLNTLKDDLHHRILREYSKMITFAILYGAGAPSLAKSMRKSVEEGVKIINDYYKGNPKFKAYIDESRSLIKEQFGLLKLPIFNHYMYIGNPFHYSLNQKALNYQIQNISSSLTSHSAFHLYLDLLRNYFITIDHLGFIHDAIEFEFFVKDIFTILDRVDYWYKGYDYDELGIPSDYDYEIGLSKYSVGGFKYSYSEDKSIIEGSIEVKNYYVDDIDKIVNMFRGAFEMIEDRVEDKGVLSKYPFTIQAYGNKPHNWTQDRETKKYMYHFKLKNPNFVSSQ